VREHNAYIWNVCLTVWLLPIRKIPLQYQIELSFAPSSANAHKSTSEWQSWGVSTHKRLLFPIRTLPQTSRFTTSTPNTARSHRPYCTYYGFNSAFKIIYLHFKTSVCSKCKEMLILLYWPSERTNPMTSHTVVLQDGGALAPKAITKQPFFL